MTSFFLTLDYYCIAILDLFILLFGLYIHRVFILWIKLLIFVKCNKAALHPDTSTTMLYS